MNRLLILGAGGHGKVIYEAAMLSGNYNEIAFLDDSYEEESINKISEINIIGKINNYKNLLGKYKNAFVALGNNKKRIQLINDLLDFGYEVPAIIHPKAYLSSFSKADKGTAVLAGAVVNVNTKLGLGNIININSTVDHDCILEEGCHVCSGATIRSMVKLEKMVTIKAGSVIETNEVIKEERVI